MSSRWSRATAARSSAPATPRPRSTSRGSPGLTPAGVICEIMNDDGTMARRNDLITFAQRHGLKIGTIADLIAYRRRYDSIVRALERNHVREHLRRRLPLRRLRQQGDDGPAYRAGEGRSGDRRPGHGAHARASTSSPTRSASATTGRGGEIEASMREIAEGRPRRRSC